MLTPIGKNLLSREKKSYTRNHVLLSIQTVEKSVPITNKSEQCIPSICREKCSKFLDLPRDMIINILKILLLSDIQILLRVNRVMKKFCEFEFLKNLKHFCLSEQEGEMKGLRLIFKFSYHIQSLYLNSAKESQLTDMCFPINKDDHKFKKLRKLVIRSCDKLTVNSFTWIANSFHNITTLGNNNFIRDIIVFFEISRRCQIYLRYHYN